MSAKNKFNQIIIIKILIKDQIKIRKSKKKRKIHKHQFIYGSSKEIDYLDYFILYCVKCGKIKKIDCETGEEVK